MNNRIRVSPVRLIGPDGEQIGILPIGEALQRARDLGLDLVEVAPKARPPVCRIMDYGKYKYELAKKDRQAKKKQQVFQLKEMRFRPKIDEHDYRFKKNHVREFLEAGNKVRVFVRFRGREIVHQEMGHRILNRIVEDLSDIADVDMAPKQEGNTLSMVLSPKPEVFRRAQEARVSGGRSDDEKVEAAAEKSDTAGTSE